MTLIKFFVLLVSIISIVSCTTVTPIRGPDGTQNLLIACTKIDNCYTKASEVCNGPYKIVNTNSEVSGSGGYASTTVKLLVKCEK